ncbi:MAG: GDP-mannose 4,6-dehydratase [Betaproteobacteria bacterium]|nr:GDP-mannose 4,6-dehydratase [Betaproteobacteria bacterium]
MRTKVLITGITGQDGAYLAKLCLDSGDVVVGGYRHVASASFWRLKELDIINHPNLILEEFDLTDPASCFRLVKKNRPDEIYNLGAQSFVSTSFSQPAMTAQTTGFGAVNLLEAMRTEAPEARFYQASTSEMFGLAKTAPQDELTPFHPRSPYAAAKAYAHWMVVNYREAYGLHGVSGILFNHESPLRGAEFVTRKITKLVALIAQGHDLTIELGNLDARRDWGYAPEYVDGMRRMLKADKPSNYVLATGQTNSVRDFVKMAFQAIDTELRFEGEGLDEIALDRRSGKIRLRVSPELFRPADIDALVGNPKRAIAELNWCASTGLESLCELMVRADIDRTKRETD